MEFKEAVKILEDMCYRYGKPEQQGRTEQQVKEIKALNVILGKHREGGEIEWIN